jgi:3-hydroxymyristoyl/3-hydroxydecanoyl-(acyl carrier protein) dehydratase
MALNFLGMCSLPVYHEPGRARAEIDVKRFTNWRDTPMSALLTEGINQFAVRFARTVLPGVMERRQRVLPVGIRNLQQLGDLGTGPFLVEGDVSQFGPTARVRITVSRMAAVPGAPLMKAEIAAAVAGEGAVLDGMPGHVDNIPPLVWNVAADPLFRPTGPTGQLDRFGFEVSATCPLLEEHFPGFPVAPGSLVLAHVWEQTARRLGVRGAQLSIDDARFVRPVTPGVPYTCTLRDLAQDGKPQRWRFVLTSPDGAVHTQGIFHFAGLPVGVPEEQIAEVVA